eukprot:COSAG02_NODE_287_length_25647_cov_245.259316_12_plen_46_part_00
MSSSDEDFEISDDEEMHDPGATFTVLKRAVSALSSSAVLPPSAGK